MKTLVLSFEEQVATGASHLVVITSADLTQTTAATAQTLVPMALPAGCVASLAGARLVTPFADSADAANNSCTITVGDAASANRYLAATQVNANGSFVTVAAGVLTALGYPAAGELRVAFSAPPAGKTLAALNKGELHLFVRVVDLARATKATV